MPAAGGTNASVEGRKSRNSYAVAMPVGEFPSYSFVRKACLRVKLLRGAISAALIRVLKSLNEELRSAYFGAWYGMRDAYVFHMPGSPSKYFALETRYQRACWQGRGREKLGLAQSLECCRLRRRVRSFAASATHHTMRIRDGCRSETTRTLLVNWRSNYIILSQPAPTRSVVVS